MRSILAVFLLFLLLYSRMEGYQLCKAGVLFTHFSSHAGQAGGASFLSLLQQHYSGNEAEKGDADHEEDRQLPFKSFTAGAPLLFFPPECFRIKTVLFFLQRHFNRYCNEFFLSGHIMSVFKPPAAMLFNFSGCFAHL